MKIHSDILTPDDVRRSTADLPGVCAMTMTSGSRSRSGAVEMHLTGTSSHRPGWGNAETDAHAATWDEWGIVLGRLFAIDPSARVANVYESAEHYAWVTGGRFSGGTAIDVAAQHRQHKWDYDGRAVTGSYSVSSCKCGAIVRRMAHGRDFAEIAG